MKVTVNVFGLLGLIAGFFILGLVMGGMYTKVRFLEAGYQVSNINTAGPVEAGR